MYFINGKVIFGELTFTPGGALDTDLQQGDIVMGEMIDLKDYKLDYINCNTIVLEYSSINVIELASHNIFYLNLNFML